MKLKIFHLALITLLLGFSIVPATIMFTSTISKADDLDEGIQIKISELIIDEKMTSLEALTLTKMLTHKTLTVSQAKKVLNKIELGETFQTALDLVIQERNTTLLVAPSNQELKTFLEYIERIDDNQEVSQAATTILGYLNKETEDLLTYFRDNENREVRLSAAHSLCSSIENNQKVKTAFIESLKNDESANVRSFVAYCLRSFYKEPKVKAALVECIKIEKDENVWQEAGAGLTIALIAPDKEIKNILLELLMNNDDADVRGRAAYLLRSIARQQNVKDALVNRIKNDNSAKVKRISVESLEISAKDKKVRDVLLVHLKFDKNADVRSSIAIPLRNSVRSPSDEGYYEIQNALIESLMNDINENVRRSAAIALRAFTVEKEPREALIDRLKNDESAKVREGAALALDIAAKDYRKFRNALLECLKNEQEAIVRKAALNSLSHLDETTAKKAILVSLTNDEDQTVRIEAANSLRWEATKDRNTRAALIERLKNDASPNVRAAAAVSLHFSNQDEEAKAALFESLNNDKEEIVRNAAANALKQIEVVYD